VDAAALPARLRFGLITDGAEFGGEFLFPAATGSQGLVAAAARWTVPPSPRIAGSLTSSEPMMIELHPDTSPLELHIIGVRFVFTAAEP
jgi:hypothetical protein